jgi:hypothetical protein
MAVAVEATTRDYQREEGAAGGRRDVEMEAGRASVRIASPGDEQGFRVPRVPVPLELLGLWPNWARAG